MDKSSRTGVSSSVADLPEDCAKVDGGIAKMKSD